MAFLGGEMRQDERRIVGLWRGLEKHGGRAGEASREAEWRSGMDWENVVVFMVFAKVLGFFIGSLLGTFKVSTLVFPGSLDVGLFFCFFSLYFEGPI